MSRRARATRTKVGLSDIVAGVGRSPDLKKMGKRRGFLEIDRQKAPSRPVDERVQDWREVYLPYPTPDIRAQGARCMDCGIPFCHEGCPLGNVIPDWNDQVYRGKWRDAIARLHKTNNFPEWTGRLCPAPCEGSCVLAIDGDAVTIKAIELSIVERAFEEGWITPSPPKVRTGKTVAVVGSGPAGLAAADQLNRAGHAVTVFEKSDRLGGLLRYGIPEFKMEKRFITRRLKILRAEGSRVSCWSERRCRRDRQRDTVRPRRHVARWWGGLATRPQGAWSGARGYLLRDGIPDTAEPRA